jgi:hypothetical protein
MQNFTEWLAVENLQITQIDPEEDWEFAEKAYQIAKSVNIHISSNKNPTIIALNDDEVIGAVFAAWSPSNDDEAKSTGEDWYEWDYDIVVDPKWQGYRQVGLQLIRQAEETRKQMQIMYGQKAYTHLWVVNPKLARVLQTPRYGFELHSDHGKGGQMLRKFD